METRNITFNLPTELIREAKVYAARHDTNMNVMVRELLQEMLGRERRIASATDQLLALASQGPYFSADLKTIHRDDLYER